MFLNYKTFVSKRVNSQRMNHKPQMMKVSVNIISLLVVHTIMNELDQQFLVITIIYHKNSSNLSSFV